MDKKKITMNVVTGKKDRRKSVTATFVNLIHHQRDGYIAMKLVESLVSLPLKKESNSDSKIE